MKKRSGIAGKHTKPAGPAAVETQTRQKKNHHAGSPFPIVGIGASAGGLEALELFIRNVAADR